MLVEPIETALDASELFDAPDENPSPWWPSEDMPGAEDGEWIEAEQMPRGKYFIGDPCYVLDNFQLAVSEGIPCDLEGVGRIFWKSVDSLTASTDQETTYFYDSMSIGITPVDHLSPGHWAALKKLGRLIEWKNGDLIPEDEDEDEDEDWEGATMVGIDFHGNLYLGNDWWLTDEFLESPQLPPSLAHLRNEEE